MGPGKDPGHEEKELKGHEFQVEDDSKGEMIIF